eukprot:CAMPEP_0170141702 /NCGR_PEP_ID=MMETSP0033_2-20121228/7170_1 /TAXON_ID=195969 /ORGANISM="Dolichomastix tenuilepis, Strain CCMP3274" /LENGTH=356 /DNA_ID=CAMNT_0010377985 /DNA_START=64 /DNA_END=1131 /DNA_ORIENTATION=+
MLSMRSSRLGLFPLVAWSVIFAFFLSHARSVEAAYKVPKSFGFSDEMKSVLSDAKQQALSHTCNCGGVARDAGEGARLLFLHLQKTGGSSIENALVNYVSSNNLTMKRWSLSMIRMLFRPGTPDGLAETRRDVLFGHWYRDAEQLITPPRSTVSFTMLREPAARTMSHFFHNGYGKTRCGGSVMRFARYCYGMRYYYDRLKAHPQGLGFRENFNADNETDTAEVLDNIREIGNWLLSGAGCVGTLERFDESMLLCERELQPALNALTLSSYCNINPSAGKIFEGKHSKEEVIKRYSGPAGGLDKLMREERLIYKLAEIALEARLACCFPEKAQLEAALEDMRTRRTRFQAENCGEW